VKTERSNPSGREPQVSDRLTPEERAARQRRSQRLAYALRHPTHVTNPDAMRDAIRDAMWNRPTIGALRGKKVGHALPTFDWDALKRRVDQERQETRRSFSLKRRSATSVTRLKPPNRAYGVAVLDAECWRVAQTPAGNRNNTLASAAFKVGRGAVGPGYLGHDEAFANLLGAALDSGLPEREARPVIRSGLRAGARHPRGAA
jgi:hypothetical protein